jgi:SAM-dependent methyltransferase
MGILQPYIHLFCIEQKKSIEQKKIPIFRGDVLTLGQQAVFCSWPELKAILATYDLPVKELPPGFDTASKIPDWKNTPYEGNPNAQTVFTFLGADRVYATDISTFENPDFSIDLNERVDASYYERFDTIVDVGTLEHVFDIPTALQNVVRMCRKGGSVVLINPSSGAIDHGFYQFSPTLYFDYFGSNGFSVVSCYLNEPFRCDPVDRRKGRILKYESVGGEIPIATSTGFDVIFVATKSGAGDGSVKPFQSWYARIAERRELAESNEVVQVHDAAKDEGGGGWKASEAPKRWVPTNPRVRKAVTFARLMCRFRFLTIGSILLSRTKSWHPLWLNRYLFNQGRGSNIHCIAKYSASGDFQLVRQRSPARRPWIQ